MKKHTIVKNLRKKVRSIVKGERLSYGQLADMSNLPKTTVYRFIKETWRSPKPQTMASLIKFTKRK